MSELPEYACNTLQPYGERHKPVCAVERSWTDFLRSLQHSAKRNNAAPRKSFLAMAAIEACSYRVESIVPASIQDETTCASPKQKAHCWWSTLRTCID